jgi:hypothetical protein
VGDPLGPRLNRLLFLLTHSLGSLYAVCFIYAFRNGTPDSPLPEPTGGENLVVYLLGIILHLPLDIVLGALLNAAARSEFARRYPCVHAEMERRKVVDKLLAVEREAWEVRRAGLTRAAAACRCFRAAAVEAVEGVLATQGNDLKLQPTPPPPHPLGKEGLSLPRERFQKICEEAQESYSRALATGGQQEEQRRQCMPCTGTTLAAMSACFAYALWCTAYLMLFGLYMPAGSVTLGWLLSQCWGGFIIKPLILATILMIMTVVLPNTLPSLAHSGSPGARTLARAAGAFLDLGDTTGETATLSGRFTHWILPRAAASAARGGEGSSGGATQLASFQWNTMEHTLSMLQKEARDGSSSSSGEGPPDTLDALVVDLSTPAGVSRAYLLFQLQLCEAERKRKGVAAPPQLPKRKGLGIDLPQLGMYKNTREKPPWR